jgi:hypothetical protein
VQGGGGGVNCDNNPILSAAFDGPSATYTDFEDNTINGGVSISALQSCCEGNSPAAQIGDSEGSANVVTGRKIGECASL